MDPYCSIHDIFILLIRLLFSNGVQNIMLMTAKQYNTKAVISLFHFLVVKCVLGNNSNETKCFNYKGVCVMVYSEPLHTRLNSIPHELYILAWECPKSICKTLITRSQLSNYVLTCHQPGIGAESCPGCSCCGLFVRVVRCPWVFGCSSNGSIFPWQADSQLWFTT